MAEANESGLSRRDLLIRMAGISLFSNATGVVSDAKAGGHTMPEFIGYPPSDPELIKEIDAVLKHTAAWFRPCTVYLQPS